MIALMREKLQLWDVRAFRRVSGVGLSGHYRRLWYACSRLGDGPFYVAFLLTTYGFLPQGRDLSLAALTAFAFELPLYAALKRIFRRKRPFVALPDVVSWIVPPDEFSFPSGHTAGASLIAVLGCAFFPVASPLFLLFAGAVGFSRVALGVHYPGDVLAGMLLGSLCGFAGLSVAGL